MRYGRSADGRKTDRYGKKYSWIAFYELAGFRQDKGLLSDYYDQTCAFQTLILIQVFLLRNSISITWWTEDFLGDRKVSLTKSGFPRPHPPNLTPLFENRSGYVSEKGFWILLDGFV